MSPVAPYRLPRYVRRMAKKATAVRITPEVDRLWTALAAHLALNRTATLEYALKKVARLEGLKEK